MGMGMRSMEMGRAVVQSQCGGSRQNSNHLVTRPDVAQSNNNVSAQLVGGVDDEIKGAVMALTQLAQMNDRNQNVDGDNNGAGKEEAEEAEEAEAVEGKSENVKRVAVSLPRMPIPPLSLTQLSLHNTPAGNAPATAHVAVGRGSTTNNNVHNNGAQVQVHHHQNEMNLRSFVSSNSSARMPMTMNTV